MIRGFLSVIRSINFIPRIPGASHPKHLCLVINAWNKTKKKQILWRTTTQQNNDKTKQRPKVVNLSVFTMSSTNLRTKAVFPTPFKWNKIGAQLLQLIFHHTSHLAKHIAVTYLSTRPESPILSFEVASTGWATMNHWLKKAFSI